MYSINLYFTRGGDSVVGVSFNLISKQSCAWVSGWRLVKSFATHCTCDFFSVVTASFLKLDYSDLLEGPGKVHAITETALSDLGATVFCVKHFLSCTFFHI